MISGRCDIAVIGMTGRFPGAGDLAHFWRNLRDGRETVSHFTLDEVRAAGVDAALLETENYVAAGGILDGAEEFDAGLFGYSPREAETIDPQHRIFLQSAWHALENAGYDPWRFAGAIGVFAGCAMSTYLQLLYQDPDLLKSVSYLQLLLGNDKDYLASRVSYKLNLTGPSVSVQTACSTSLVAVSLACDALVRGDCDMALAGGVTVRVPQHSGYWFQKGGITSRDGKCRPFDEAADGTVFGNGVGIVVLKPLQQATLDGDHVEAVLRGWAINNDGALKIGYTAPSQVGQARVVAKAIQHAGVDIETISYVETHGTGTVLGDPIEIAALTDVFRASTDRVGFCAIGSVKANIGHLDPTAGIASLIKAILALKHRELPPAVNFQRLNPALALDASPFYVNETLKPWPGSSAPRRVGVSSFGIGGTNAHVIVEEAPSPSQSAYARSCHLVLLSASTGNGILDAASDLRTRCQDGDPPDLGDVAYTTQVGRRPLPARAFVVCDSMHELLEALDGQHHKLAIRSDDEVRRRPIAYLLPGQGSQYPGMGAQLYRSEPLFRATIDEAAAILWKENGLDLCSALYGDDASEARLRRTRYAQPALFAVECAMSRLLMHWGLVPTALIGHSVGEYAAACIAGTISFEDGLRLVARRAELIDEMPPGAMLAVGLSESDIDGYLSGSSLAVAAVNDPSTCVVSGPVADVEKLMNVLTLANVASRRLNTSHAFHSSMMEPVLERYKEAVARATFRDPQIPFISNVTGTWISGNEVRSPDYWARHVRATVQFSRGISALVPGDNLLLEVGPGNVLTASARRHSDRRREQPMVTTMRLAQARASDARVLMEALGHAWASGSEPDWDRVHEGERCCRTTLPGYRFERQRYWPKARESAARFQAGGQQHDIAQWFYRPTWKRTALPPPSKIDGAHYLLLADSAPLTEAVIRAIEQSGAHVTVATPGANYVREQRRRYQIRVGDLEDYEAVMADLDRDAAPITHIVHLLTVSDWSLVPELERTVDWESRGYYSLLHLTRAIAGRSAGRLLRINVVTNHVWSQTATERITPAKAVLIGPCKTIPQEYAGVRCRCIDVGEVGPDTVKDVAADLAREAQYDCSDAVVVYRDGRRFLQTFEQLYLPAADESRRLPKAGSVWLITGGLGSVGLALADFLVTRCGARVALLGRSGLNRERRSGSGGVADEDLQRRIAAIDSLVKAGGDVFVAAADVTDVGAIEGVIADVRARYGSIDGVIHAAGSLARDDFPTIPFTTAAVSGRQFAAKHVGLTALERAFGDDGPRRWVLASSLASILGGIGFTAYAAANAVMDAYATDADRRGRARWTSICWDSWDFTASDSRRTGALSMSRSQGVETFARLLAEDVGGQVVVSTGHLPTRIRQWVELDSIDEPRTAAHARPRLATEYIEPQGTTQRMIASIWTELLGVTNIGADDHFFRDLGGHSLLATQVASRLRSQLGSEVEVRWLFDAPTISQLATQLDSMATRTAPGDMSAAPIVAAPRSERRMRRSATGELSPVPAPESKPR